VRVGRRCLRRPPAARARAAPRRGRLLAMAAVGPSDGLEQPLMSARKPVQVYSPYGKEVVNTQRDGRCLSPACLSGVFNGGAAVSPAQSEIMLVIRASFWINFFLFLAKMYTYLVTHSYAVLASLVDSTIDLLGQGVLMWTKKLAASRGNEYPIGRERLEPVGVMLCAVVMGLASVEVISTSSMTLWKHWGKDDPPIPSLSNFTIAMLVFIVLLKAALMIWCWRVERKYPNNSDSVKAIGQDNQNDVISNIAAILAPAAAIANTDLWSVDPIAGVLISVYIIYTWVSTGYEQVEMLVGKRADPEFLSKIQSLAEAHHAKMQLDQVCAYHFGPRYLVEIEVVMPENTTLRDSHDAGITLQHEVENLEDVERCFVHIDYQLRQHDDHDPEVPIEAKLYGGPRPGSPRGLSGSPP